MKADILGFFPQFWKFMHRYYILQREPYLDFFCVMTPLKNKQRQMDYGKDESFRWNIVV